MNKMDWKHIADGLEENNRTGELSFIMRKELRLAK